MLRDAFCKLAEHGNSHGDMKPVENMLNPVFTVSDKLYISYVHVVSTACLRHVDGFPVLGLLRRLRPRCA